jgi:hypothetical protein
MSSVSEADETTEQTAPSATGDQRTAVGKRAVAVRLPLVVILLACTLGFGLAGYFLRPSDVGPPSVPNAPSISFTSLSPQPSEVIVQESVGRNADNSEELDVNVYAADLSGNGINGATIAWSVDVRQFTGYNCYVEGGPQLTDVTPITSLKRVSGEEWTASGSAFLSDIQTFAAISLCWRHGGPAATSGAFLSVNVPQAQLGPAPGLKGLTVTRSLCLRGLSLDGYAMQVGRPPDAVTPDPKCGAASGGIATSTPPPLTWTWTDQIDANQLAQDDLVQKPYVSPLPLQAARFAALERDNHDAFLSGVLYGIAGAALIGVITELVGPLGRRRHADDGPTSQL